MYFEWWWRQALVTGGDIENPLKAAEQLRRSGIDAKVVNMHRLKLIDGELVANRSRSYWKFVTLEEGGITGGLDSL